MQTSLHTKIAHDKNMCLIHVNYFWPFRISLCPLKPKFHLARRDAKRHTIWRMYSGTAKTHVVAVTCRVTSVQRHTLRNISGSMLSASETLIHRQQTFCYKRVPLMFWLVHNVEIITRLLSPEKGYRRGSGQMYSKQKIRNSRRKMTNWWRACWMLADTTRHVTCHEASGIWASLIWSSY